jgi:multidrug resistance efflux pump
MAGKTLQAAPSTYMEYLKMKIKEINCETGEEIVRDATNLELQQAELDKASADAELETLALQEAEKATAKAQAEAKLAALGLTADDLKALGLGGN